MSIAKLTEHWPAQRALIGVQPLKLNWGEALTPEVALAIPEMCRRAAELVWRWRTGT
jgi:hydrogenase maturation protease